MAFLRIENDNLLFELFQNTCKQSVTYNRYVDEYFKDSKIVPFWSHGCVLVGLKFNAEEDLAFFILKYSGILEMTVIRDDDKNSGST